MARSQVVPMAVVALVVMLGAAPRAALAITGGQVDTDVRACASPAAAQARSWSLREAAPAKMLRVELSPQQDEVLGTSAAQRTSDLRAIQDASRSRISFDSCLPDLNHEAQDEKRKLKSAHTNPFNPQNFPNSF